MLFNKPAKTPSDLDMVLIANKLICEGRDYHDLSGGKIIVVRDNGEVWLCQLGEENNLDTVDLIERIL